MARVWGAEMKLSTDKRRGSTDQHGYVIRNRFNGGRNRFEHSLIVQAVLGRNLPPQAVVHHVNESPADNRVGNFIVFENNVEHMEFHRKMRVRAAGGDPWLDRLCIYCGPQRESHFYRARRNQAGRGWAWSSECKTCHTIQERRRRRNRA